MRLPLFKNIITLLFLVAFLAPRVVDLHALEHTASDDEPVSCELCDITAHSQSFDLFVDCPSYEDVEPVNRPSTFVVSTQYNSPLDKIVTPTSVYNKPPPKPFLG